MKTEHWAYLGIVGSNPPTYQFEVDYENRYYGGRKEHATGRVTLYEDGDFNNIWLIE